MIRLIKLWQVLELKMKNIRFDDSLPQMVQVIAEMLGEERLLRGVFLRDISGRLSFFSDTELEQDLLDTVSIQLEKLGPYIRLDRPLAGLEEPGTKKILAENSLQIPVGRWVVRMVDRRLVGADWLREPTRVATRPSRFVFASLKGGVGRTTALSVVAAHFAAQGKRVLAIDLDMEAPGLGSILLDKDTTPEFGLIDALVEVKFGPLDDVFMADMVGPSSLADRSGKIDVVPAFGRRSISNPGDVLAKISRAYTEQILPDGSVASILDQVSTIVDYFAETNRYDVILIDARAGLHETTASAILGLGAHVFLFGLNEPQTFQGYAALLSHLCRITSRDEPSTEWLSWLTMVQGKAPDDKESFADFSEKCRNLFAASGIISEKLATQKSVPLPAGPFNDVPWDDEISDEEVSNSIDNEVDTICVLEDEKFRLFDPLSKHDLLTRPAYAEAYAMLLRRIDATIVDNSGA
ncbi:ParA family protein [Massilia sp. UMI-21]|nr:ParA family protein [Massilia sp. UMI-21]